MSELYDDGSYSISGAFGEVYYVDPTGKRPPMRIFEVTGCQWAEERAVTDVQLAGNESGSKKGAVSRAGSFTVRQIDEFWENLVAEQRPTSLAERRAARDRGERTDGRFTLHVWVDDPDALGAIGHELTGVDLSKREGGFDLSQPVTTREHPFRFAKVRRLKSFERVGNETESNGLPKVRYITPDNG